ETTSHTPDRRQRVTIRVTETITEPLITLASATDQSRPPPALFPASLVPFFLPSLLEPPMLRHYWTPRIFRQQHSNRQPRTWI
ncbi:hypothetical protein PTTG_30904, partial [Puccinia triticina 1-1 BBBD Race 1]